MRRAAILLALGGACAQAWPQAAARIELLPQVQVQGDRVVLGEVAHLQSNDLRTIRALADLPLGPAPRAGAAAVVRRDTLVQWIRQRTGLAPESLDFSGAAESRVMRASQHVEGERVAEVAAAGLRAWLQQRAVAADVQVRRPPRDLDLPGGELRLAARPPEVSTPREHLHVWVDLFVAGRLARSVPVTLQVQALAGGELSASAMTASPRPLEHARTERTPLAVSRGDWGSLHTAAGAVSLVSRVEVLQDGRIGDKVRVRQHGATGLVLARVVAPGELELAP